MNALWPRLMYPVNPDMMFHPEARMASRNVRIRTLWI
jgi:hypothetical protein